MRAFALHFLYLDLRVLNDPQWKHLTRFLHPGSQQHSGEALAVGTDLDLSYHPFLSIRAVDWANGGSRVVLLRHDVVASVLEVSNHTNQFGFVDLSDVRERLAVPENS